MQLQIDLSVHSALCAASPRRRKRILSLSTATCAPTTWCSRNGRCTRSSTPSLGRKHRVFRTNSLIFCGRCYVLLCLSLSFVLGCQFPIGVGIRPFDENFADRGACRRALGRRSCLLARSPRISLACKLRTPSRLPRVTLAANGNGYSKRSCHFSVSKTVFILRVCSRSSLLSLLIVVNSNLPCSLSLSACTSSSPGFCAKGWFDILTVENWFAAPQPVARRRRGNQSAFRVLSRLQSPLRILSIHHSFLINLKSR